MPLSLFVSKILCGQVITVYADVGQCGDYKCSGRGREDDSRCERPPSLRCQRGHWQVYVTERSNPKKRIALVVANKPRVKPDLSPRGGVRNTLVDIGPIGP
jgi:hypothetical protein